MRLSEYEKEIIVLSAKDNFEKNTRVILFGSRANETGKGGNIDLLTQPDVDISPEEMLKKKINMLIEIEQKLGEQRVDIILQQPDDNRAIVKIAKKTGIAIC